MHASKHWFLQRVSAGMALPGVCLTIFLIKKHLHQPHEMLKKSLSNPITSFLIICIFITFIYHARLGLQIIITDYLKGMKQRVASFFIDCLGFFSILALAVSLFKIMVSLS